MLTIFLVADLLIRLENFAQIVRSNSDSRVGNRKSQPRESRRVFMIAFDPQRDAAALGEFDGVPYKIQENLAEAVGVGRNRLES